MQFESLERRNAGIPGLLQPRLLLLIRLSTNNWKVEKLVEISKYPRPTKFRLNMQLLVSCLLPLPLMILRHCGFLHILSTGSEREAHSEDSAMRHHNLLW